MLLVNIKRKLNGVTVVLFILTGVIITFFTVSRLGDCNSCSMDFIKQLMISNCMGIISVVTGLTYMINTKNDYGIMIILQSTSWWRLWLKKIRDAAVYVLAVTVYIFGITFILSTLCKKPLMNWQEENSLYNSVFGYTNNTSVTIILLMSFVVVYMLIFLTVLFILFGMMVVNSAIIPVAIIIVLVGNDYNVKNFPFFYNRFNIVYDQWSNPVFYGLKAVMWLFIFFLIILFAGCYVQKKREYIGTMEIN